MALLFSRCLLTSRCLLFSWTAIQIMPTELWIEFRLFFIFYCVPAADCPIRPQPDSELGYLLHILAPRSAILDVAVDSNEKKIQYRASRRQDMQKISKFRVRLWPNWTFCWHDLDGSPGEQQTAGGQQTAGEQQGHRAATMNSAPDSRNEILHTGKCWHFTITDTPQFHAHHQQRKNNRQRGNSWENHRTGN
ncbi:hypothetical protein B0H13DRAFT_1913239 [Mycena leptocephala]|nr:hypothetical protein B0H13DRAFT_1913239 [Mycena leptocephala]